MPVDPTTRTAHQSNVPRQPASPARSPSNHETPPRKPAPGSETEPLDADAAEPVPHEHLPIRSDDN